MLSSFLISRTRDIIEIANMMQLRDSKHQIKSSIANFFFLEEVTINKQIIPVTVRSNERRHIIRSKHVGSFNGRDVLILECTECSSGPGTRLAFRMVIASHPMQTPDQRKRRRKRHTLKIKGKILMRVNALNKARLRQLWEWVWFSSRAVMGEE